VTWFDKLAQSLRSRISDVRQWAGAKVGGGRRDPRLRYERVEDFPDVLNPATLYVAGEEPHVWAAALLCPCGCGDVIELNLMEQASPCWSVRKHRNGSVTLMPSVWRTKGCRSHFFIRNSRVVWCRFDSDLSSAPSRRR
jgi:hypothetical protein